MIWPYLLQGIAYGFSAAVQPGPLQTYLINQSLKAGWRRALPVCLAPLVSDGPIIALSLLLLSRLPAWLERGLFIGGGAFILYLAFGALREWRKLGSDGGRRELRPTGSLLRAVVVNLLNPAPYIYWSLVTGPILLAGWRQAPAYGLGFLASFYIALVFSLAALIVIFGKAAEIGPRVQRALLAASVVVLTLFGLLQIWRGLGGQG